MDVRDLYQRMVSGLDRHIEAVPHEAWNARTSCCPDWKVRDLVNHVVYENVWVPPLFAGETVEGIGDRFEGDLLGSDPVKAWQAASRSTLATIAEEGALDRKVTLSSGPTTATSYIAEILSDQVVHTWDLATSVGTDDRLDPELVRVAYGVLKPLAESWRAAGVLGPEVEVDSDADTQTRLLALTGRRI